MPKQPVLIENHLETASSPYGLLMVHEGRVITYSPPLATVTGAFCDDGQGGLIAAARTQGGGAGYINASGDWLVAPDLADARSFGSGTLARYCEGGLWGYMGLDGKPALAPRWRLAEAFQHGLAAVQIAPDTWRYIDERGQFAFDGEFFIAHGFSANGLAAASPDAGARLGYLNRHGAWVIAPRFVSALPFAEQDVAPVAFEPEKFGLINAAGVWVAKPLYRYIHPFNADGLAWCKGLSRVAYLDTSGDNVFKGRDGFSHLMVDGAVRASEETYMTRDGNLKISAGICWGGEWTEHGVALALTWSNGHTVNQRGEQPPGWGILRTDGQLTVAPENAVEPLGDFPQHGDFLAPEPNTPLTVFIGNDDDLLMLDRDARVAFRLRIEQGSQGRYSALYDAQARLLWTGPVSDTLRAPERFFFPDPDWVYDELDSADQLADVARAMLRETEQKLRTLARDPQFDIDAGDDDDEPEREHDDYERYDDDDDEDMRIAKFIRTRRRLAHFYNDEEVTYLYGCLGSMRHDLLCDVQSDLEERMGALFGPADDAPDFVGQPPGMDYTAWSVALDTPLTDDAAVAPEAKRLWLAISWSGNTGDGDEWGNVWLTCAPSIETLELAMLAREALDPADSQEEEEEEEDAGGEEDLGEHEHGDLLAMVTESDDAIARLPQDQVTDELADAAVAADTGALRYLPARFQTPQRLEALIRQSASCASDIPAICMSAQGLALARSLYKDDEEWADHDEFYSMPCTDWDRNALSMRWAALIDTSFCERALHAGARIFDVPLWLRTAQMEALALRADIDNLPYVSRELITAEIAARAVSEGSPRLLGAIPPHLVTPALCLAAVKHNGQALAFVHPVLRTFEMCVAAVGNDWKAIASVPEHYQEKVCTHLIDDSMAAAADAGRALTGTSWHALRAWLRMHANDFSGALADATAAREHVMYPIQARFLLAWAHRALGNAFDSALEAATVLQMGHLTPEFAVDTSWLGPESRTTLAEADEADLLRGLHTHPLALSKIPQRRITPAMAEVAVMASSEALEFVPKKLMRPELRALAAR
ncbi:WG repeat-containing protein [Massilia aquatica]|uniref:WG repeat-containing protein n=1 Tax=Massilia aquatica TaxID=2609000 RepID=A0ABX0MB15_9BURK|nr:WG repeat-containing protein [Massilia aquatica]NHZ44368.1 WG repeat-containing protein [Massilia aquatica]